MHKENEVKLISNNMTDRKLTFGKYKGRPIKEITLTHIGYIMWCLNNLSWFSLTDEEQAVYDAMAIALVKDDIQMVFPREDMVAHIKDKEALKELRTPFYIQGTGVWPYTTDDPVVQSVLHYRKPKRSISLSAESLMREVVKQYEFGDHVNDINADDIDRNDFIYGF